MVDNHVGFVFLFFKKINVHTTKQVNKLLKYRLYGSCPLLKINLSYLFHNVSATMMKIYMVLIHIDAVYLSFVQY